MDLSKFEAEANIHFRNQALLMQAFTHRSYLNENRKVQQKHYERLEFFGDAVLGFVVAEYLFEKYPEMDEAELTTLRAALVNWTVCYSIAEKLGVNNYLLLSKGESKTLGRPRQYILANVFEAIIGAIYLDQGLDTAKVFILKHLVPIADAVVKEGMWMKDPKSLFQEHAQVKMHITPTYKIIEEFGLDNDKSFVVGAYLGNELIAKGEGRLKQEAEKQAAYNAIKEKGWN
jgi:ribonuclease-3